MPLRSRSSALSRRLFLQHAAVAATAITTGRLGAAQRGAAPLGFSLYGMKALPLDQALQECARIGYGHVELALLPGFPTEASRLTPAARAEIRRQAADAGVGLSSLMVNLSLAVNDQQHAAHLETLRLAATFASEIDPAAPPVIETVLGGKPDEWDALKGGMAGRARDWDAVLRPLGATVALKAHVASAVNAPDRLLWLLREAGGERLAAAYDFSHFALAGLDLAETVHALAPHTRFVHVKDGRREGRNVQFLLPGEGTLDFRRQFRLLRDAGYRGPIVVEVSGQISNRAGYDPVATAAKCFQALQPALPD